mgnify:CR=1 FL=1
MLRAKGSEVRIEPSAQALFESSVSRLGAMVMTLYDSVDFTSLLCDEGTGYINPKGAGIPFTIGMDTSDSGGQAYAAFPNKCGKALIRTLNPILNPNL